MDEKKIKIIVGFFYLVLALIAVSFAILVWPVYSKYHKKESQVAMQKAELSAKNAECLRLHKEVYDLQHKPDAVEKVAREKFGLCRDGETIMRYREDGEAKKGTAGWKKNNP